MKPAKKNRDEVRENCLTVLLNAEEKNKIREAADDIGVTMSAFARIVLNDFMKKGEKS